MGTDIKFSETAVTVEGNLGVNEATPRRTVHVTGQEVHSGGNGAGFSFSTRDSSAFVDVPTKGERWVWYADKGKARLWSGADHLSIDQNGHVSAYVTSAIRPFVIHGSDLLGRPPSVWLHAQDLILSKYVADGTGKTKPAYEGDSATNNYALSHMEGDVLVINRGVGFKGGVRIEGDKVTVGGTDLLAELKALRAEVDALKAKVK